MPATNRRLQTNFPTSTSSGRGRSEGLHEDSRTIPSHERLNRGSKRDESEHEPTQFVRDSRPNLRQRHPYSDSLVQSRSRQEPSTLSTRSGEVPGISASRSPKSPRTRTLPQLDTAIAAELRKKLTENQRGKEKIGNNYVFEVALRKSPKEKLVKIGVT
jgi:hypothetical protein